MNNFTNKPSKEMVRLAVKGILKTSVKNKWETKTLIELARLYLTDKLSK